MLGIDASKNTLTLSSGNPFFTGDTAVYEAAPGRQIGGLEGGQTYYVILVSDNEIKLAATETDANAGKAVDIFQNVTLENADGSRELHHRQRRHARRQPHP